MPLCRKIDDTTLWCRTGRSGRRDRDTPDTHEVETPWIAE
jgi:hypothetical protein